MIRVVTDIASLPPHATGLWTPGPSVSDSYYVSNLP